MTDPRLTPERIADTRKWLKHLGPFEGWGVIRETFEAALDAASTGTPDGERSVYIAGPMTGLPDFNFPAFAAAAERWRAAGWHVESPHENFGGQQDKEYADYIRAGLAQVCRVRAIALLPGWERSRGAKLETHVADLLGLAFFDAHSDPHAPAALSRSPTGTPEGDALKRIAKALDREWVTDPAELAECCEMIRENFRRMCDTLQASVWKHKLGLGGEHIDKLVTDELDRLAALSRSPTAPSEADLSTMAEAYIERKHGPGSTSALAIRAFVAEVARTTHREG